MNTNPRHQSTIPTVTRKPELGRDCDRCPRPADKLLYYGGTEHALCRECYQMVRLRR